MNKIVITLTQNQLNNLLGFLQRVNLTGKEVPAFNEIITAINNGTAITESKN